MLIFKLQSSNHFLKNVLVYSKILKTKFLFLKQQNVYIQLPSFIYIKKCGGVIYLFLPSQIKKQAVYFFCYFFKFFKKLLKINRKKLTLVGLGFKVVMLNTKVFSLKLGYSHLINIQIPVSIKFTQIKNNIYLESYNPVILGTFANILKNLKRPDQYKGKGFWFRSEKKKLKPVKKA